MDSLSTSFDNLYFPAITVCNINFMQRSVLEKYNLQNNETLIDIFDRMMNKGSDKPFTPDELEVTIENTIFQAFFSPVFGHHQQMDLADS